MSLRNAPLTFELKDFSIGWDNKSLPTTLDKKTVTDIRNFNLTSKGGVKKRGGLERLYPTSASVEDSDRPVTNIYEYKAPDKNNYLLIATNTAGGTGEITGYYNGVWNGMKLGLTPSKRYSSETHRGLCYMVNGVDNNFKFRNTTSYNVGIAAPLGAPSVATGAAGTSTLYTNHPITNIDYIGEFRQNAARTQIAQSFELDSGYDLTKVVLKLRTIGNPTGQMIVQIHSDQEGTQVGGNSDLYDVSGLSGTLAEVDFPFNGVAPSLSKNTTYYIVILDSGDMSAVSSTNFTEIGVDWESGYTRGAYFEIDGNDDWTLFTGIDLGFQVWGASNEGTVSIEFGAWESAISQRLRRLPISYLLAQKFKAAATGVVTRVTLPLKKIGSPGANLWVEIHSSTAGTSGDVDASTNIVGTSSDVVATSSLTGDREWVAFQFTGTEPPLTGSTDYYIVLYTDGANDTDNYVNWTQDGSGYANGTNYRISDAFAWNTLASDFSFKVSGEDAATGNREEHSLDDITQVRNLRETNSQQMVSQSFTVDESANCTSLKVYMAKTGSPTGSIWAEIHKDHDNTSASKNSSGDSQIGQASDNVDVSTLDAFPTFGWQTFTFSGTAPNLNADSRYYLVIYGNYTVSADNFANIAIDKVAPGYDDGVRYDIDTDEDWSEITGQDIIFEIYLVTSGLSATYYYCYTYKRIGWLETEGNPSDISDSVSPSPHDVTIGVVASTDPQVDEIVLYRTLAGETTPFYKQGKYANSTASITDSVSDDGLTTLWEENNNVPPKAKFIKLHKDMMFYANCPDEDEGGSLVMWSKSGNGEQVPSANHQYFDKDDGEDITGIASLRSNVFVFKPNKIGVLNTTAPELWYLGHGIGCIAPWAILTFKDKIIFLAEEGWKATDGNDIWDLSENISDLLNDGYITINEQENYSVAFYPKKEHFQFLINHSTETPKVIVGHFLVPLILKPTGISELVKQNIMGWTYHEYDYHKLTCISTYTDDDGITRLVAGDDDGFIYKMDSGGDDEARGLISVRLRTDWLSLGIPRSVTKVVRKGYLTYGTNSDIELTLTVDADFGAATKTTTFAGADRGLGGYLNKGCNLSTTGKLFRFTFVETSVGSLEITGLVIHFRSLGVR